MNAPEGQQLSEQERVLIEAAMEKAGIFGYSALQFKQCILAYKQYSTGNQAQEVQE